jgi:hypothetical protein
MAPDPQRFGAFFMARRNTHPGFGRFHQFGKRVAGRS